jgi:hypothetical protein
VRGEAVSDARGVVHCTQGGPEPFTTMLGGIPGQTWCRVLFYDSELGPESCTMTWVAVPMTRTEAPVNCMTCLVIECR